MIKETNVAEVYHYTSLEAAINGIFTPKQIVLKCSHYAYLNDPNEMRIGRMFIENITKQAGVGFPIKEYDTYILSLSKQKNSSRMWDMYGNRGKGIMLEFKTSTFSNLGNKLKVKDCLYCNNDGHLVDDRDGEKLNKIVQSLQKLHSKEPNLPIVSILLEQIKLEESCGLIKSSDFQYEDEARVVLNLKENEKRGVSYEVKNNIRVPRYSIYLPKNAVSRIWVGPTQDKERIRESLGLFLQNNGYDIKIDEFEKDFL